MQRSEGSALESDPSANPSLPVEPHAGFTLIDVLVGLTVLSTVALLSMGFIAQIGSLKRAEAEMEARAELAAVGMYLNELIASAVPLPAIGDAGEKMPPLLGSAERLYLVAVVRTGLSRQTLRGVTIQLAPAGGHDSLVQRNRPRRPGSDAVPQQVDLLSDVTRLSFSYFGVGDGPNKSWRQEWQSREMPEAVRIDIAIRRGANLFSSTTTSRLKLRGRD